MKTRKEKPDKSVEMRSRPKNRDTSTVRAPRKVLARGEVITASRESNATKISGRTISPTHPDTALPSEEPAKMRTSLHISIQDSRYGVENPSQNRDRDAPEYRRSVDDLLCAEYLDLDISSSDFESLSEYSAEKEVEAAMLEADLAIQADESALIFEESVEGFEAAQDSMSLVWTEGGVEFT
jgi:hypothetical protein